MSDPDDPSSKPPNRNQIRSEWDKQPDAGTGITSAPPSKPSTLGSGGNESEKPKEPKRSKRDGKRHRLKDRFRRSKHRHEDVSDGQHWAASGQEKFEAVQGEAPNTTAAPQDPSAMTAEDSGEVKRNVFSRFFITAKEVLLSNYFNLLLIFVPVGIAVNFAGLDPGIIFAMNAIAIIPLAGLLAHATEVVAQSLGDTLGALLNVSFGNAVELIIFIIALVKNEINIVQASLIGSILSNLLLILGMSFLFGGLRFQEQLYNNVVTQMSACLLSLSVTSLVLPTAFHASFSSTVLADIAVLKLSRGTSVILLIMYVLYLLFQLKSHAYMYESTPQHKIDEESRPGVLTEFLNSSSSSSDSNSSGSGTDSDSSSSSSGSHRTAKRFKRAFRRRRKSSASTADMTSSPSKGTRSSSVATVSEHPLALRTPSEEKRPAQLNAIASGDEADTDGEHDTLRQTRSLVDVQVQHRDFGDEAASYSVPTGKHAVSPVWEPGEPVQETTSVEKTEPKHKHSKKGKKHKKKTKHHHPKQNVAEGIEHASVTALTPLGGIPESKAANAAQTPEAYQANQPSVSFANGTEPGYASTAGRRPLMPIPAMPILRPQMTKMLSNTVFSSAYNAQAITQPAPDAVPRAVSRAPYGLRRASSLPNISRPVHQNTPNAHPSDNLAHVAPGSRAAAAMAEEHPNGTSSTENEHEMSRTAAVVMLLISTGLVALCAEFLVSSIDGLVSNSSVTEAFIGLIILPIVGNAAEHVTAVTVATKNKMDLAIGVAVGSSIQIALFVTPIVVLLGWILDKDMSLYFTLFETVSLFVSAFIVNFLVLDGRSNYLEGALLCAAYVIIAVGAFFYPNCDASSGAACNVQTV